jgi:hypothetical protein
MEENSEYISINDLTEKLKEQVDGVKNKSAEYKKENDTLKKDNLEKFILEKTGELVEEGLDTIRELKSIFVSNPNAEEIDSLAQAFKAVTSALSVLKDIQVTESKIANNKELKEMDIKARKELKEEKTNSEGPKLLITRDEMLKKLIENSDVVDVEFEIAKQD